MKRQFLLIFSMAMILVACNGENSITGTSDLMLTGQIVAGPGMTGSSGLQSMAQGGPLSGVDVRARGTGVAATSDGSGRFTLFGLPSSVELTFTRADGINAQAKVNVASNPSVIVELTKTTANVMSTGQSKQEIEGLITVVSADSITVADASTKRDQTAAITTQTVIRHGNTMVLATELGVGDRVHVRALINGDGSLTAIEIKLQNPAGTGTNPPPSGSGEQNLEGLILSVSCSEMELRDASRGDVTVTITPETTIRHGNTTIPCDQLKQGDRVHVKATVTAGTYTAREIKLQNPA